MKILDRYARMENSIEIFVPSTINKNTVVDNKSHIARIQNRFLEMFGGYTTTSAGGGWLDCSGHTITEEITIVQANCTNVSLKRALPRVLVLCKNLKESLLQEAISLKINGTLYLID